MPPREKGKKPRSKSTKNTNLVARKIGKKSIDDSASASTPRHGSRSGLRSGPLTEPAQAFEDNPESILRKRRKSPKVRETTQAQDQPDSLAKSIESSLAGEYRHVEYGAPEESLDEETPLTDPEQIFYRKWGYLPPLDEEAVAVIDAIIADPSMVKDTRISPPHKEFPDGLALRNVSLEESPAHDPRATHVRCLALKKSVLETHEERESHGQLWTSDQAKCNAGSSEALFQRTLMMSFIARHLFIYKQDASHRDCLDFSVEEPWTCPPMPTLAYYSSRKFLTQPKPDLAVCFRKQALLPKNSWLKMPVATSGLASYEKDTISGNQKAFHFLTFEAKKASVSTVDGQGLLQSLNNASQALHNMFEFFRDAGSQHEDKFFTKVRFFSVVTSSEGLLIRIHRAIRQPEDDFWSQLDHSGREKYPLKFEYQKFFKIEKDNNFDRKTVLKTFQKIMIGYGVNQLLILLRDAAKAIEERWRIDLDGKQKRDNVDFYRYGQTIVPPSSRIATPTPSQAPTPIQASSAIRKRPMERWEGSVSARNTRQRKK